MFMEGYTDRASDCVVVVSARHYRTLQKSLRIRRHFTALFYRNTTHVVPTRTRTIQKLKRHRCFHAAHTYIELGLYYIGEVYIIVIIGVPQNSYHSDANHKVLRPKNNHNMIIITLKHKPHFARSRCCPLCLQQQQQQRATNNVVANPKTNGSPR